MNNKRILIFNVNWLGDVLFSTATIRTVKRNFPDSFLACVIPSRCYAVLKDNPYLDEIIIYDDSDRHKGFFAKLGFIRLLKRKQFDEVYLLHRSFSRALLCWLARIPRRVGYDLKKRGFLLTKKIKPMDSNMLHRIDYYLTIVEKAGLRAEDRFLDFYVSEDDKEYAESFLRKQRISKEDFTVGINPGGNWLPKRWPPEYWARLADALIRELHAKVLITGSPDDFALACKIRDMMKESPIIASGALNLKHSAALFKKLHIFITGDTGPMHIANAVGTPCIIALFGPTSPEITGPYPLRNVTIFSKDLDCRIPCYSVNCQDNRCMKAITPEKVIEKIKEMVS